MLTIYLVLALLTIIFFAAILFTGISRGDIVATNGGDPALRAWAASIFLGVLWPITIPVMLLMMAMKE
jgi:hypothetical protein